MAYINGKKILHTIKTEYIEVHPSVVDTETNILALTSDQGLAVATDTGYWYYWNSTTNQYTYGGVYQAVELADGSVTPKKTNFINAYNNLYDYNNNVQNKYWNNSLSFVNGSGCWGYKEAIELEPNTKYYLLNLASLYGGFCWLSDGVNKTTLANSTYYDATNKTITTSTDTLYLYLTFNADPLTTYHQTNDTIAKINMVIPNGQTYNELINDIDKQHIFYVGATRDITTLKAGIEKATKYMNSIVYVDKGTYDLVSEYGLEYLNNNNVKGLELINGVRVIFSANSKVTFNYTGTNSYIKTQFSPFNTGIYGGTLENAIIECSNCRYCIHDDRSYTTDTYHNKFINCEMYIDNSDNEDWSYQEMCIGGGFGLDGIIEIINCVIDKNSYYHQNADTSQTQSKCDIYFIGNYVRVGNFHVDSGYNSIPISKFYANNNATQTAIPATTGNVKSYLFNNILLGD